jgi:SSS family solute:Na+ symporter
MPEFQLHPIDILMVAAYVVVIVWLGFHFARRTKTTDDYFLAGRSLTWWLIVFSLLASNMSSATLIGLSGEAYADGRGIAAYNYEWMAAVVLVFFIVFFLPFYLRSRIYTMPEFLEKRFDARSRYYFSGMTILGNIMIDTAGALYAGALVVKIVYPEIPMWQSVSVLAVLAGLYTIAGGLAAVVYTDAIQAVLLLGGSILVAILAFVKVGSWEAVTAVTPPEMLSLIRPADDPIMPWPGLLTGVFLLGFYFWGTNQFMVQRVLGAKNLNHGRWGAIFAGFLKLPIIFIMVLPGTFARVLYPGLERADMVMPTMMFDLLPIGVRGLLITALVAAIMSSVDSTLNSASTLVTMDFVKKLRPASSNRMLVISGRITTGVFMILATLWAPQILRFPSLWEYLQLVLSYLSPPVVACFLVGLFWKRANRHSAFLGLLVGHMGSIVLLILQPDMHFLYIPPILVALSAVTMVIVSYASEEPDPDQVARFTWSPKLFRAETAELAELPWFKNYRVLSIILLICTAVFVAMWW